jgi:hypothetical protein
MYLCFMVFVQGQMQREKKALRFGPPICLKDMEFMFEKSRVSGLSACIPGEEGGDEGGGDSLPNEDTLEEDDPIQEIREDQFSVPPSSVGNQLKRKQNSASPKQKSPMKKREEPHG